MEEERGILSATSQSKLSPETGMMCCDFVVAQLLSLFSGGGGIFWFLVRLINTACSERKVASLAFDLPELCCLPFLVL